MAQCEVNGGKTKRESQHNAASLLNSRISYSLAQANSEGHSVTAKDQSANCYKKHSETWSMSFSQGPTRGGRGTTNSEKRRREEKKEMNWICPEEEEEEEPSAGERMLRSYFQVQTPQIDFSGGSIDAHLVKWQEIMSCCENGLDLAPAKAKRRKAEMVGVHGGRVVHCAGRKDRHSKVSTARGTRDRRLRLSPRTAIQFYDVQDRLGYDRPSKVIDWLMKEAKAAIDALEGTETLTTTAPVNENPTNNFGFFAEPPHDSMILCSDYQDGLFDAELEMERMQRVFSSNYSGGGATPLSFPITTPVEMFSHREPLQSSSSRISTISNLSAQFPEISFSNEELVERTSVVNRTPSSSPSAFPQYEE